MNVTIANATIPTSLDELKKVLLENRAITDEAAFFQPLHPLDITPESVGIDLTQLEIAVERIRQAKTKKEKILIYGDYDADGICATSVLWRTLSSLGYTVKPFIPDREKHGYGLSERSLESIKESQPDLIITVDNGIVAHQAIEAIQALGIPCIVTDHHQPEVDPTSGEYLYPPALAVVHTTQLCGTTVAWMLAKELAGTHLQSLLALCGLATIADQVPLVKANRAFAWHGVRELRQSKLVSIKTICSIAKIDQTKIDSQTVGFQLAPRINAVGRISNGMDALRLLCTDSQDQAQRLASILQTKNSERQELTTSLFEDAILQAEEQSHRKVLIITSDSYHEGVIGLIAGKLTEKFYKPTIVISHKTVIAKASARSLAGISIIEILRSVRSELLEVGGHPMAAGFSVSTDNIENLKEKIYAQAQEMITDVQLVRNSRAECILPVTLISTETVRVIKTFDPFGQGNPEPQFLLDKVKIKSIKKMGSENQHLKLELDVGYSNTLPALWWRAPDLDIAIGDTISLVCVLEINEYKGRESIQVVVRQLAS